MNSQPKRIVLVEEDAVLRDITAFRLELLGYWITQQESAEDALTYLQRELPDLVIVGHFLPGMQGADFIERLSTDLRTSQVPVLFLSPNSGLDDVQKAFNAGAKDYLVTPFDPVVLEQKVSRLVDRKQLALA